MRVLLGLGAYVALLWLGLRGFNRLVPRESWEWDG